MKFKCNCLLTQHLTFVLVLKAVSHNNLEKLGSIYYTVERIQSFDSWSHHYRLYVAGKLTLESEKTILAYVTILIQVMCK